ncbi:glycoside hydrolase family 71 protein [Terrimonas sp. NA20]|uniref:Glycoside hydrolase family 71 protein n=1 Tax=Terrimonas ginsenosidimutans TaxID=2908004 RepID=A0ABS9KYE9_9BACT|nr:glycoside hydrolase family 71 protein [Terrimonas ginsenosidimutans]MCG2617407.1 glycoside hydrolase family 71 protein [Terrimonas ginsenosidimutans]
MYNLIYRTGILSVVILFLVCGDSPLPATDRTGKDMLKNRDELSLPVTGKKLVIAHCMTNIIRYKGHKMEDSCNPEFYPPYGNISASLGGLTQVIPLSDSFLAEASLDEAVEFEMKAAKQSGIDGFQFYYTLGNDSWDEIIRAYLRVAKKKNIDFKFTFCISHPSGGTEDLRVDAFGHRIKKIMDEAGHDDPHWLRTPDGRLILYTWYGESLADIPEDLKGKSAAYYIANAYNKLEKITQEKFACIISINEQISQQKLDQYLDYFPAVWLWTLPYTEKYIGNMVAKQCKKRKRTFTGSAFSGFYTSKLLKKGTWDMFHFAADAAIAGISKTERKYIATGLSYNFRKQWEFGIQQDVPLFNIITWNDYPEGHHLAPEINHNDGFSILLNHYKEKWKNGSSLVTDKDVIIAFYKKYHQNDKPSPFNIPVVEIEKRGIDLNVEDSIEVVTILKENGEINLKNSTKPAPAGLHVTRFAGEAGAVLITLTRNNKTIRQLNCPEWITKQPYRTDRLTYSFSTESLNTLRNLFGTDKLPQSTEYNPTIPENHLQYYKSTNPAQ